MKKTSVFKKIRQLGICCWLLSSSVLMAQDLGGLTERQLDQERERRKDDLKDNKKEHQKKIDELIKDAKEGGNINETILDKGQEQLVNDKLERQSKKKGIDTQKFSNVGVPLIDKNSGVGSAFTTAAYVGALLVERGIRKPVDDFMEAYTERGIHHGGALMINRVLGSIRQAKERQEILSEANKELSFIRYSRKKDNEATLAVIEQSITRLLVELRKQAGSVSVILGDRINLYHSIQITLKKIHGQMDEVAANLERSNRLKKIDEKLK